MVVQLRRMLWLRFRWGQLLRGGYGRRWIGFGLALALRFFLLFLRKLFLPFRKSVVGFYQVAHSLVGWKRP